MGYIRVITLGAPKRKRRNARSGSHDTIAGPERNWKGLCFGVMINTNAFTGPRKTHPQVGQYVFPIFHCKGVGCVYISSENAFDKSALLVDRKQIKTVPELNENKSWMVILLSTWLRIMVLSPFSSYSLNFNINFTTYKMGWSSK